LVTHLYHLVNQLFMSAIVFGIIMPVEDALNWDKK